MDGTFGNEVCVHLLPIKEAPCLMQTAEILTMVRSVQCMPNRWRNGLAWPSTAWCPLSWHWQIDSEIDLRLAKVPAQVQMGSMQDWGMFLMTWLKSYPNVKLWRLLGECHVVQSLWKSSSPMSWKPMSPNRWPTGLSTHCVMKTLKKSSQPQWLNSWKKGYHAENQAHSKRQNSSQSTPSIKSTDTRGSQSIKSMNSSHIPTVQNLRNAKNLKTKSHPFLAFTCFSLKPKCWFEVKTVCCSRPRQWRSHGSLPAGHVLSMIKTWFVEYCTISTVTLYSIFVTILKEQELAHTSRPDALSDESSWVWLSWLMFSWASREPKLWAAHKSRS